MPHMKFSDIPDNQSFKAVPDGDYACTLVNVEKAETKGGDERWKLRFQINDTDEKFGGRMIFDDFFFTENAGGRIKLVCSRLGLDVSEDMDLEPKDILNREVIVTTTVEDYEVEDPENPGQVITKERNVIPYAGYKRIDGKTEEKTEKKKVLVNTKEKKTGKKAEVTELPF